MADDEAYFMNLHNLTENVCMSLIERQKGNKWIGAHTMFVFLAVNRYELEYTQKELIGI